MDNKTTKKFINMSLLADFILFVHILVAVFISFGILIIPIGGILNWHWCKNFCLRALHLGLTIIVFGETIVGVSCPLTVAENFFRENTTSQSFIGKLMEDVLYWNLSATMFLYLYGFCSVWLLMLWLFVPPIKNCEKG